MGVLGYSPHPQRLILLEANAFSLSAFTNSLHRNMTGLNEKVLCIVHSVIQKLERHIHYTA